jgi:hypothetical protein
MPAKPVVLSFVLCRQLVLDPRTQEAVLLQPTHHVVGASFPLWTEVSLYSTWRQLEGTYHLESQLMTPEGDVVWFHPEKRPLVSHDRFMVHRIILHPLRMLIPAPGVHDFILMANGEEVVRTLYNVVYRTEG